MRSSYAVNSRLNRPDSSSEALAQSVLERAHNALLSQNLAQRPKYEARAHGAGGRRDLVFEPAAFDRSATPPGVPFSLAWPCCARRADTHRSLTDFRSRSRSHSSFMAAVRRSGTAKGREWSCVFMSAALYRPSSSWRIGEGRATP